MPGRKATAILETLLAHPARLDPGALDAIDAAALVEAAAVEYVVPLAARALERVAASTPHARLMHAAAAAWALREAAERRAIADFLDAAAGVPLVFFKGASTAYSLYDDPALRVREDWDVIAAPGAEAAAARALERSGFAVDPGLKPGRLRMRQRTYRRDVPGSQCSVDLHLRALNPPALADRVTFTDLDARSVPLRALHPAARGVADEAALVLACLHRLAHHSGEPRLAWDCDVLLLVRRADAAAWAKVEACAAAWRAGAFVAAEVRRVLARFDEPIGPEAREAMARLDAGAPADAAFLRERRSRAREFLLDWRAIGWKQRAALVGETLVPDRAFMRASTGSRLPLPLLYARRIARGALGWFRSR